MNIDIEWKKSELKYFMPEIADMKMRRKYMSAQAQNIYLKKYNFLFS